MTATAAWTAGTLTVVVDGATETSKRKKAPAFLVVGTGNAYTASGIWMTTHASRALAAKARETRGAGSVVEVAAV